MIRIQVQLSQKQLEAVRRLALAEERSVSDVVREGVDAVVHARAGTSREEAKALSLAAIGKFRSGRKDLSREHDRHLAEAFAG